MIQSPNNSKSVRRQRCKTNTTVASRCDQINNLPENLSSLCEYASPQGENYSSDEVLKTSQLTNTVLTSSDWNEKEGSTSWIDVAELEPYHHNAGGHHIMLRCMPKGIFWKELSGREETFYRSIEHQVACKNDPSAIAFRQHIPEFCGVGLLTNQDLHRMLNSQKSTATLGSDVNEYSSGGFPHESDEANTSLQRLESYFSTRYFENGNADCIGEKIQPPKVRRFILLRDITHGFQHPCVLDIKMGTRQYGLHPSLKKYESKIKKSLKTTTGSLGFRLCGMRVWNVVEGKYSLISKSQGRNITKETMLDRLRSFFLVRNMVDGEVDERLDTSLLQVFLQKLNTLEKLFSFQETYHFYTSSLLLAYDDDIIVPNKSRAESAVTVMVDFAHTYSVSEIEVAEGLNASTRKDEGYLWGLRNLIVYLESIYKGLVEGTPPGLYPPPPCSFQHTQFNSSIKF